MPQTPENCNASSSSATELIEDPIYRHACREAKIILAMWLVAFVVTCTYCYLYGYSSHPSDPAATGTPVGEWVGPLESFNRTADSLRTPLGLGIPDWVFYGIILPWLSCIVATFVFCTFIFENDELGDDSELTADEDQTSAEGRSRND